MQTKNDWFRDLSLSTAVAGFVAVLVGFTSSVAIVFQAAQALGATPAQTSSWMWALGLGMGLTSLGLSWWSRQPILTAWSTPGAALLAATSGLSMPEAVGAFLFCAVLILIFGLTGWFERLMDRIPLAVAAALLAGVLARFGLDAVLTVKSAPELVLVMAAAYLLGRRFWARYAVPGVLLAGVAVAALQGRLHLDAVE
ncbi:MAG: benzoate/H(+) symporter BenE family transporter, partial [Paucibacter sp.]|nr:benzoate/H(+) symporter BenE family transporter [Roseateles sp.]